MNINRLYDIINLCTVQSNLPVTIEGPNGPIETVEISVHFFTVVVLVEEARKHRAELIEILKAYPQPDRLREGPSYIETGGVLGDQGTALRLYGLGEALGLWTVITPATFHIAGEEADYLAGQGYVLITGFRPEEVVAS